MRIEQGSNVQKAHKQVRDQRGMEADKDDAQVPLENKNK